MVDIHSPFSGAGEAPGHPDPNEVEKVFTDTPQAATDEVDRQAAMADANEGLQADLQAHIEASVPPSKRGAFDAPERGPNA